MVKFVEKSLAINNFLIAILNDKLGLPKGTLASQHEVKESSGCTARVIRAPPYPGFDEKTFLTAHTDFGSLVSSSWLCVALPIFDRCISPCSTTALVGYKSSLRALTNGSTSRCAGYFFFFRMPIPASSKSLQPIPGYAICNIGDTLNIFSGGILRSNIHRVVCVALFLCFLGASAC